MNALQSPAVGAFGHSHTIGVYGLNAPEYGAEGPGPFPVRTRERKPAVRNWQKPSNQSMSVWSDKFSNAHGLGTNMGTQSALAQVNVDAVGQVHIAAAVERFGETPVGIQTASGKAKLWYRHNGEQRMIRPFAGLPVDVLGGWFQHCTAVAS